MGQSRRKSANGYGVRAFALVCPKVARAVRSERMTRSTAIRNDNGGFTHVRQLYAIVFTLLFGLGFTAIAVPAQADDGTGFSEFHVDAVMDPLGRLQVTTRIEYDFQDERSRGIYLTFVTAQDIEGDAENERVYPYSDFEVTSSTGAATQFRVEHGTRTVGLYIGDPDQKNLTGVHSYEVSYVVAGIPNAGVGENGEDEIYWNIIGTAFAEPIRDFQMRLSALADPLDANCWAGGRGSAATCEHAAISAGAVEFRQRNVQPGQGVTIAAQYPAGTFDEKWAIVSPKKQESSTSSDRSRVVFAVFAGVIVVLAATSAKLVSIGKRFRRDQVYLDLPPGLAPAPGQNVRVGRARPLKEYPVQFHPPVGQIPADIGVLVSMKSKPEFLTATIVDLAVRGYVQIVTNHSGEWTVHRLERPNEVLTEHERNVIEGLFSENEQSVELENVSPAIKTLLNTEVLAQRGRLKERGWLNRKVSGGPRFVGAGIYGVFAIGAFGTFVVRDLTITVIAGSLLVAVLLAYLVLQRPWRTAEGSVVYAQAMGFKKFIETADAEKLQFEADEDIFSRYLPHAMVFGLVKKWVELFQSLGSSSGGHMEPLDWIQGPVRFSNLNEQLLRMDLASTLVSGQTATRLAAQTESSSGSSGGSGFSGSSGGGGGGSVGGGVGGGGGGRW